MPQTPPLACGASGAGRVRRCVGRAVARGRGELSRLSRWIDARVWHDLCLSAGWGWAKSEVTDRLV